MSCNPPALVCASLSLAVVLGVSADAQEKGRPASMDELSKRLFDSWNRSQYDLVRAGAREASCTVRATIGEKPGRTIAASGVYRWDGKKGSLTWDNARVGKALAHQGWGARKIDMWFKADRRLQLDGLKLVATKNEDGTTVVRTDSAGQSAPGQARLKEIRFDRHGVLTSEVTSVRGPGGPVDVTMSFKYVKVGDLYAFSGWTMELGVGATKYSETNEVSSVTAGGFFVITEAVARSRVGSPPNVMERKRVLTFSDWKINGKPLPVPETRK